MAIRKPIVVLGNNIAGELPPDDRLPAPGTSGQLLGNVGGAIASLPFTFDAARFELLSWTYRFNMLAPGEAPPQDTASYAYVVDDAAEEWLIGAGRSYLNIRVYSSAFSDYTNYRFYGGDAKITIGETNDEPGIGGFEVMHTGNTLNIGQTAATAREALELGSAALERVGTSGTRVPLLDGVNFWSQNQTVRKSVPSVVLSSETSVNMYDINANVSDLVDGGVRFRRWNGSGWTALLQGDSSGRWVIGSTTITASAALALDSTTRGFLPPRMTTTQRDAIASPATGLIIHNTTTDRIESKTSTGWAALGASSGMSNPMTAAGDIVVGGAAGAPQRLGAGNAGETLRVVGGTPTYRRAPIDMRHEVYFSDDFLGKPPTSTTAAAGASYPWVMVASSGSVSSVNSPYGAWSLNAAATGNYSSIVLGQQPHFSPYSGDTRIRFRAVLPTLSNSTDGYSVNLGLRDVFNAAPQNGVFAFYSHNVNSGNWVLRVVNGGVTTDYPTSVAAVAGTWVNLEIAVPEGAYVAGLFINDVLSAYTSNIPTPSMMLGAYIGKNNGTASRSVQLDYAEIHQQLTTPR